MYPDRDKLPTLALSHISLFARSVDKSPIVVFVHFTRSDLRAGHRMPSQSTVENNVPLELIPFKFSPDDLEFLSQYKKEWQDATRTERSKIATRAFHDMKKVNPDWMDANKKLKKDVR